MSLEEQQHDTFDISNYSNLILKCNQCPIIPSFHLTSQNDLQIKCPCKAKSSIPISTFLNQIKQNTNTYCLTTPEQTTNDPNVEPKPSPSKIDTECKKHLKEFKYYCIECKDHLCEGCYRSLENQAHNIIELKDILTETYLDEINKNLNLVKNHFYVYIKNYKDFFVNSLQNKIDSLNNLYEQKGKQINNAITMIQLLLNQYKLIKTNYTVIKNITSNTLINLSKFIINKADTEEEQYNKMVNYLERYSLLKSISPSKQPLIQDIKKLFSIEKHKKAINSLISLYDHRIASCSDDGNIRIYSLTNDWYKIDIKIRKKHHDKAVTWLSEIKPDYLISAGDDKLMKVWEIKKSTFNLIKDLQFHTERIRKVIVIDHTQLISISEKNITLWKDYNNETPEQFETRHEDIISSVLHVKYNNILISAGFDSKVIFWNFINKDVIEVIDGIHCFSPHGMVETLDGLVLIGEKRGITVVDPYYKTKVLTVGNNYLEEDLIGSFFIMNNMLFCASQIGCMFHIDMNNYQKLFKKELTQTRGNLPFVVLENKVIASCTLHEKITIWKYTEKEDQTFEILQ